MGSREAKLGVGVFLASLAVLLVRFLVPRPVGLADNGDGGRLLCQLGGNDLDRPLETFVRFLYQPAQPCATDYMSSQLWLDRFASRLGHLLGSTATLNVLIVGLLSCLLAAAGVSLIVFGLWLSRWHKVIASAALLLLVADSAFFGYFASVLSEFTGFLGLLLLVAGLLLMRREGRLHYVGAVVTLVGAVIGINAKVQTLLILPVLFLALFFVGRTGRRGVARWAMPVVVLVAATGSTALFQAKDDAGTGFREMNMYHAIFHSIVDGKHDSRRDLADIGLPASFAKYADSTWWTPVRATQDPAYPQYEHLISRRNVAHYYLTHPLRTTEILQQAGTDLLTARPDYLGSFGERSGLPPRTKEYRVPVLSGLTALIAPLGLLALIPWWLLLAAVGLRSLLQRRTGRRTSGRWAVGRWAAGRRHPELGLVVTFLVLNAVGQFVIAALGEGVEGVKHQTIALFCTLLATLLASLILLPRNDFAGPESAETAAARRQEPAADSAPETVR